MPITIEQDRLSVPFSRFGLEEYELFLKTKRLPESQIRFDPVAEAYTLEAPARFAHLLGVDGPDRLSTSLAMAEYLFDYQQWIGRVAVAAKRYAVWADCGLGKTALFLEWARHVHHRTGGRVLILSPLEVIPQTVENARLGPRGLRGDPKWTPWPYRMDLRILTTREELATWCTEGHQPFAICNYEKLIEGVLPDLRHVAGLVADESSLLKSGGGVIRWHLIKSARGIEYKLSCTATPAPNDIMEYASQASFLEKLRSEGEILWTYFTRDPKTNNWKVKPHAREAFFRFMASWSIYLRDPKSYGWGDNLQAVPAPSILEHRLEATVEQLDQAHQIHAASGAGLFGKSLGVTQRTKLSQLAKGFLYGDGPPTHVRSRKPDFVASLIQRDVAEGRQVLVWTIYDEETALIEAALQRMRRAGYEAARPFEVLSGKTKPKDRQPILERFRGGHTQVLISKASMLGYGLDFEFCTSMIFSGFDDSFEAFYQAVRRAVRYGQTRQVNVHIPYIPDLEGVIWNNVLRKQANFERDAAEQERCYRQAMKELIAA